MEFVRVISDVLLRLPWARPIVETFRFIFRLAWLFSLFKIGGEIFNNARALISEFSAPSLVGLFVWLALFLALGFHARGFRREVAAALKELAGAARQIADSLRIGNRSQHNQEKAPELPVVHSRNDQMELPFLPTEIMTRRKASGRRRR